MALPLLLIVLGYAPRLEGLHDQVPILLYFHLFSRFDPQRSCNYDQAPTRWEEVGWRGSLLPRLLERNAEARASIVIGIVRAL